MKAYKKAYKRKKRLYYRRLWKLPRELAKLSLDPKKHPKGFALFRGEAMDWLIGMNRDYYRDEHWSKALVKLGTPEPVYVESCPKVRRRQEKRRPEKERRELERRDLSLPRRFRKERSYFKWWNAFRLRVVRLLFQPKGRTKHLKRQRKLRLGGLQLIG